MSPSYIDLIFTSSPKYFPISNEFKAGLSDFHNFWKLVIKASYYKLKTK